MKQTNNAIKFLMAQYRAIFKNAYFKGLTSAVLLTAGLAVAGNAQATISNQATWEGLNEDVTLDGSGGTAPVYDKISITGSGDWTNDNTFTINVTGASGDASSTIKADTAKLTETGSNTTINLNAGDAASGGV